MFGFSWLTGRTTHKPTTKLRTTLSLESLDSREVPSAAALHANPNALLHANPHAAFIAPVQSSSISGVVQVDSGAGATSPYFAVTVSLSINGTVVQTVNANPDGSFAFTLSSGQSGTYS